MPIPLGDRILFEEVQVNHKTAGSRIEIVMPTRRNEDGEMTGLVAGKCVAMGPGQWDVSGQQFLKPSEKVSEGKYYLLATAARPVQIGLKKYLMCRMSAVEAELGPEEVTVNG